MKKDLLDSVMRRICAGKCSRADAAERLQVSERHVNRLMKQHGVERPPHRQSPRQAQRLRAEAGRRLKEYAAALLGSGQITLEQAAREADCSERTMRRWVKKLSKSSENGRKTKKKR